MFQPLTLLRLSSCLSETRWGGLAWRGGGHARRRRPTTREGHQQKIFNLQSTQLNSCGDTVRPRRAARQAPIGTASLRLACVRRVTQRGAVRATGGLIGGTPPPGRGSYACCFLPVLLHSQALTGLSHPLSRLFTACMRDDRARLNARINVKDDHHDTFPLLPGDVLIEGSREC